MNRWNNISSKSYSSKLILFGEYGVIQNGEILALPLSLYNAEWQIDIPIEYRKSGLQLIYNYLQINKNNIVDLALFARAIEDGIYLKSNIPSGYGLGSSGAITAGIYDLFVPNENKASDISTLKRDLIGIESCFHGVSSGIDPLVISLDKSIHINGDKINILEEAIDLSHYFLIDTNISRKTTPLVNQYLERAQDISYLSAIGQYKKMCSTAISAQLNNDQEMLSDLISKISRWQYEYLDFTILDKYRDFWYSTLDRDDLSIKLCGAGGGGFLLGYAHDVEEVMAELNEFEIIRL